MRKALIVQGGWDGHEPVLVSERFADLLRNEGFETEISDNLNSFSDQEKLLTLDLIVPVWTMGEITNEQCESVSNAVASGAGLAGCHGGMCDSFRQSVLWQFMTGGNWVAYHVLDLMHGFHYASKSGRYYDVVSKCEKPQSLALGLNEHEVG